MNEEQSEEINRRRQPFNIKRLWPIGVLAIGFGLFFLLGLDHYLTFESLRQNRAWLLEQVQHHAAATAIAYIAIYIGSVAFSLPGGALLTVVGGFLFGQLVGVAYVVIGASTGATALFLIAKTTVGDALEARMGPWLKKMEAGFQKNAFNYLLAMRLIPLFPFFVVNLVPAFLGVRLQTYILATVIGIVPGTFVLVQVGVGLGSIFESGEELSLANAFTTDIVLALIGLAILSLLPILYKKFKGIRSS